MSRFAARLAYFVRTALRGIAGAPVTSVVAVATIGVTLVLVGAFALLVSNMERLLEEFGDALHVTAFLEAGLPAGAHRELAETVMTVEGVEAVRIISQEQALERFRSGVGRGSPLLEGLSENPLPASLEIVLVPERRSAEGLDVVVASLDGLPGIADLRSGQDWVEGYLRAVALVRGVGIGLALILAVAALLIVANTIRLAVLSRRDELEILSLVGASRGFVNTPFLLEGFFQGTAGGAAALLLLYALFRLVLPGLEFGMELLLGGVAPRFFTPGEALTLVLAGATLGLLGSAAAVAGGLRS